MNKGIVMEMTSKHLLVMTGDGQFLKLPRRHRSCRIGEEIQFSTPGFRWQRTQLSLVSGLVAAMVFALIVFSGTGGLTGKQSIVAYVTVDINPSVEFGIDSNNKVREATGLNDEGKDLLKFIKYEGRSLEKVSTDLMTLADEKNYLDRYLSAHDGTIVITSTVVDENNGLDEELDIVTEKVKKNVEDVLKEKHPEETENFVVTTFPAPKELREEARNKGISTGKLAIELLSKEQKKPIPSETLEKQSIHDAVKELGGIDKLVKGDKEETKELLKRLLQLEQKENSSKKDEKSNLMDILKSSRETNKENGRDKDRDKDEDEDRDEERDKGWNQTRDEKEDKDKDRGKSGDKNRSEDEEKDEDRGMGKGIGKIIGQGKGQDQNRDKDEEKDEEKDEDRDKDRNQDRNEDKEDEEEDRDRNREDKGKEDKEDKGKKDLDKNSSRDLFNFLENRLN